MKTMMMSVAAVMFMNIAFAQTTNEKTGVEKQAPVFSVNAGSLKNDSVPTGNEGNTTQKSGKFSGIKVSGDAPVIAQPVPTEKKIYPKPAYIFKNGRLVKNKRK